MNGNRDGDCSSDSQPHRWWGIVRCRVGNVAGFRHWGCCTGWMGSGHSLLPMKQEC